MPFMTCSKIDNTIGELDQESKAQKQCNRNIKCVGVIETPCQQGQPKKFSLCIGTIYYDASGKSCMKPKRKLSFYFEGLFDSQL